MMPRTLGSPERREETDIRPPLVGMLLDRFDLFDAGCRIFATDDAALSKIACARAIAVMAASACRFLGFYASDTLIDELANHEGRAALQKRDQRVEVVGEKLHCNGAMKSRSAV